MYANKTAPKVTPTQSPKSASRQSAHPAITFKMAQKNVSENADLITSTTPTKLAFPPVLKLLITPQIFTWTTTLTCVLVGVSQDGMLITWLDFATPNALLIYGPTTQLEDAFPNAHRPLTSLVISEFVNSHAQKSTPAHSFLPKTLPDNAYFYVLMVHMLTSTTDVAWMSVLSSNMLTLMLYRALCTIFVSKCAQTACMHQTSQSRVSHSVILALMAKTWPTSALKPVRQPLTPTIFWDCVLMTVT